MTALVDVELANGRRASLPPGDWNSAAVEAYQEGQCLALAVAVAEHVGEAASVG